MFNAQGHVRTNYAYRQLLSPYLDNQSGHQSVIPSEPTLAYSRTEYSFDDTSNEAFLTPTPSMTQHRLFGSNHSPQPPSYVQPFEDTQNFGCFETSSEACFWDLRMQDPQSEQYVDPLSGQPDFLVPNELQSVSAGQKVASATSWDSRAPVWNPLSETLTGQVAQGGAHGQVYIFPPSRTAHLEFGAPADDGPAGDRTIDPRLFDLSFTESKRRGRAS